MLWVFATRALSFYRRLRSSFSEPPVKSAKVGLTPSKIVLPAVAATRCVAPWLGKHKLDAICGMGRWFA